MHSQKLVVLNHFTHVGIKVDDTAEYNNNNTNKHEGDNIRKKLWDDVWDEMEACGGNMGVKNGWKTNHVIEWISCKEVLWIPRSAAYKTGWEFGNEGKRANMLQLVVM